MFYAVSPKQDCGGTRNMIATLLVVECFFIVLLWVSEYRVGIMFTVLTAFRLESVYVRATPDVGYDRGIGPGVPATYDHCFS